MPLLLSPVGQQIDQRKSVTELLGATAVGVPGAVDGVAVAQEHIDGEPAAGRCADIASERADDQLRLAVEDVGQPDRSLLTLQGVVGLPS